jgi:hypothetical protein
MAAGIYFVVGCMGVMFMAFSLLGFNPKPK